MTCPYLYLTTYQQDELNAAIKRIGKGVVLDGIPFTILHLMSSQFFLDNILILLQKVFIGDYPNYGKSCFWTLFQKVVTLTQYQNYVVLRKHHCSQDYTTVSWIRDLINGMFLIVSKLALETAKAVCYSYLDLSCQYTAKGKKPGLFIGSLKKRSTMAIGPLLC